MKNKTTLCFPWKSARRTRPPLALLSSNGGAGVPILITSEAKLCSL